MATPSGLAASVGWKAETTYGTKATPDHWVPFRSESISDTYSRSEADDIISGQLTLRDHQVRAGNKMFGGSLGMYLFNKTATQWFERVLGGNTTTGSGPYTHTMTPGDLTGKSVTLQFGRPDNGGTIRPFTYLGAKVNRVGIAVTAGEYATMDVDVVAQDVDTVSALTTVSTPGGLVRYHANDLAVTIGGSAVCVRSFELEIANTLDDTRRCVGSPLIKEPLRNGLIEVSGSMEIEWTDLTHYNRVANLTTAAVVAAFTKAPDSLTFNVNAQFDTVGQPVAGRGVVYQTLAFSARGTSDANAITVVGVNGLAAL